MNETGELLRDLADLAQFPEMNPGAVCRVEKTGTVLLANKAARYSRLKILWGRIG